MDKSKRFPTSPYMNLIETYSGHTWTGLCLNIGFAVVVAVVAATVTVFLQLFIWFSTTKTTHGSFLPLSPSSSSDFSLSLFLSRRENRAKHTTEKESYKKDILERESEGRESTQERRGEKQ